MAMEGLWSPLAKLGGDLIALEHMFVDVVAHLLPPVLKDQFVPVLGRDV